MVNDKIELLTLQKFQKIRGKSKPNQGYDKKEKKKGLRVSVSSVAPTMSLITFLPSTFNVP